MFDLSFLILTLGTLCFAAIMHPKVIHWNKGAKIDECESVPDAVASLIDSQQAYPSSCIVTWSYRSLIDFSGVWLKFSGEGGRGGYSFKTASPSWTISTFTHPPFQVVFIEIP